jgi:hypothetical protein
MATRGFAAVLVIAAALITLIASGGAGAQPENSIQCEGGEIITDTAMAQECEITESPGKCIERSSSPVVVQTCTVNQTGTNNEVVVDQLNSSSEQGESTQNATQITTITQQGTSNQADVSQDIRQTTQDSGGGEQQQDGHQSTTICQGGVGDPCTPTTTNTGTNTASVTQARWADAHASGGTIMQLQDTLGTTDCSPATPPEEPNLCTLVTQNSTTRNDADLQQQDHLLAEASGTGSIEQTQGSSEAGIDGHVIQQTATGAPQNTENAHQHLTYDLSAPKTATQVQDPRIGGGSPGGRLNLHQVGILRASADDAFQHLGIDGVCLATESCLILEHGKVNGANFTTRCREDDGGGCVRFIDCTSSSEGAECSGGPPIDIDLASAGFDTLDFQNAINFTFPLNLPLGL